MRDETGPGELAPTRRNRRWRGLAWLALADAARTAATVALLALIFGALLAPAQRDVAALRLGLPLSLAPAAMDGPFWGLR